MINYISNFNSNALVRQLNNGMVVILKSDRYLPIASVHMRIKTGSITEYGKMGYGLSHFFEHSLFLGSEKNKENNSFFKHIESMGGTSINAYTSFDQTAYYYSILAENLDDSLIDLEDLIFHPTFPSEEVKNEIGSIVSEIEMGEDDVDSFYQKYLFNFYFKDLPYKYPIIGLKDRFDSLTREDLIEYYKEKYTPNNSILTIVGDIDVENTFAEIEKIFGSIKYKKVDKYLFIKKEMKKESQYVTHKRAIHPRMSFLFENVSIGHEDSYAMDVLSDILGGGYSSLLYQELKEKQKWVKDVKVSSLNMEFGGMFEVFFDLEDSSQIDLELKIEKLKKKLFEFVEDINNGKIEDRMFEMIKNNLIFSIVSKNTFIEHQAISLTDSLMYTGGIDYSKKYLEKIISVKKYEVIRVCRAYLNLDKMKEFVLIPKNFEGNSETSEMEYDVSDIDKIKIKSKYLDLKVTPNEDSDELNEMEEDIVHKDSFDNGLKFMYHFIDRSPKVNGLLLFNGGALWEDKTNRGSFNLLSEMLLMGNDLMSRKKLVKKLETYAIRMDSFSGYNFFGLSFSYLKDKHQEAEEIIRSIISNKNFQDDDFNLVKDDVLFKINKKNEEGWEICNQYFNKLFYGDLSYAFPVEGDLKTVQSISKNNIEDLKQSFLNMNNGLFSLYGDVSYKNFLENYAFLDHVDWKRGYKKRPLTESLNIGHDFDDVHVFHSKGFHQCFVQCGFHVSNMRNVEESMALIILNGYLSSLGGPLFNLRSKPYINKDGENLGGRAYQMGSFYQKNYDFGLLCLYAALRWDARNDYENIINDFYRVLDNIYDIDEKEIENIKTMVMVEVTKSYESVSSRLQRDTFNEMMKLEVEEIGDVLERFSKIKRDSIMDVARKYLSKDKMLKVVLYPRDKK